MKNANIDKKISLSDLNRPKDYIEVAERYPFAIRNIYDDAMSHTIKRHSGQEVPLHIDCELSILEKCGVIRTSNVQARMTDWHLHTEFESIKWITDQACRLAEQICLRLAPTKMYCNESWGIHYTEKTSAKRHSHFPYTFAFGYYVKMPEYAPIIFPTANYEYNPKVGDLIVFPGFIQHEVKPVEGERIMIAGNMYNTQWSSPRNFQNSSINDVIKYNS
jgi:hypothetical protein|tara:strand:+ start:433 stop:1089 length:657 start_codon:yes stop_codon:yes gene_type:complete